MAEIALANSAARVGRRSRRLDAHIILATLATFTHCHGRTPTLVNA